MIELLITLALLALVYYAMKHFSKGKGKRSADQCSSGMCGGCSKCNGKGSCSSGTCGRCKQCKSEGFRFRHRKDCGCNLCEGFRFRQADSKSYLKATNVQDVNPFGQANVSTVNTGLPFYFDAYGSELSMGPGQGDPGAVAPNAQYVDLYRAAQKLHKDFPDFKVTSYQQGGAISDLYLAKEEHDKLQHELNQ